MPQPFKRLDKGISFNADTLSKRPRIAELLGLICGCWSTAESTLAVIFAHLVHGVRTKNFQADGREFVAMEIVESTPGFEQKKSLLMIAAKGRFRSKEDEPLLKRFEKKLAELGSAARRRHRVVHGRWGISPEHPLDLVWMKQTVNFDKALVYREKDFNDIIDAINLANKTLFELFQIEMMPRLKVDAANTTSRNAPHE